MKFYIAFTDKGSGNRIYAKKQHGSMDMYIFNDRRNAFAEAVKLSQKYGGEPTVESVILYEADKGKKE